ncbi:XRE family transcriptional regulator [Shimazuella sp. AN120528]|uniref:helix-turn-helix domain-containing protein n=1 Tax=Shimazuella soli TaxID=1892854 RepID=UPI001F0D75A8|nr:XRE family transcriptional regulator [Shimazuella soli]MCH5584543.1 XRE family transcriptional regulator [Shimazuella soli]
MEEINLIIAKNLKVLREDRKLSLEKVAELTGVSKTMIGQIERGESSPTIKTIWKIASGLKISFSSLINTPLPDTKVIRKNELQTLTECDGKYRVYSNFPFEDGRRFEIYTVEIEPGAFVQSEAHSEDTEEYITVFDGELTVGIGDEEFVVRSGDSIRFKADRPHDYINNGQVQTNLSMILYYPS